MRNTLCRLALAAMLCLVASPMPGVASAQAPNKPLQPHPGLQQSAQGFRPLPPGTFNRHPLRATSVFDTQFNLNADGPNPINSYLATYLTTVVYPEFLDQLSGSQLQQNESYTKSLHTNPASFYSEFKKHTMHLFTNPTYAWIYSDDSGYNPEAMVISTQKAVFVVFRGTDRVGAEKTKAGYDYAEWVFSNFYAFHDTTDLPTLAGQVHKGFWDSLKARPKVIRQGQTGPEFGQCFPDSRKEKSFRECLVGEIRAAGGQSKKVFLMGHSLGAAQAQIFAGYLAGHETTSRQSDAIKPQGVYAVAAPHPGNDAFRDRLNALVGKSRLQRFDFVNDPVTMLPPYLLGPYQYGRAGTRIYYDDIQTVQVGVQDRFPGTSNIEASFVAGVLTGGMSTLLSAGIIGSDFCFHYPQWYLWAAWSAVPRQAREHLPVPLALPRTGGRDPKVYGACVNPVTVARGVRSEVGRLADAPADVAQTVEQVVYNLGQLFENLLDNPVADGTYILRLFEGGKFLDISGCRGKNGCKVQLWSLGKTVDNRFKIKKEIGGYSLRNGSGNNVDFLEVDGNELLDDGGRIQMWEANLPFGGHNANQLWHFYAVPKRPGFFVVRNVATGKVMDAKNDCVNQDGCAVRQKDGRNNDPTQVWILSPVK